MRCCVKCFKVRVNQSNKQQYTAWKVGLSGIISIVNCCGSSSSMAVHKNLQSAQKTADNCLELMWILTPQPLGLCEVFTCKWKCCELHKCKSGLCVCVVGGRSRGLQIPGTQNLVSSSHSLQLRWGSKWLTSMPDWFPWRSSWNCSSGEEPTRKRRKRVHNSKVAVSRYLIVCYFKRISSLYNSLSKLKPGYICSPKGLLFCLIYLCNIYFVFYRKRSGAIPTAKEITGAIWTGARVNFKEKTWMYSVECQYTFSDLFTLYFHRLGSPHNEAVTSHLLAAQTWMVWTGDVSNT